MNILQHFRKPLIQTIAASTLAGLGAILTLVSLHKTVYLSVNGEVTEIQTNRITVGGFLKEQDISPVEEDRVDPGVNALLWGKETVYFVSASEIEIHADGKKTTINTAERNPVNILLETGISLFPKDRMLVDGDLNKDMIPLSGKKTHQIKILRGTPIELQTEDGLVKFMSDADTLEEALSKVDIELFQADLLIPPANTLLKGDLISAELVRAIPVEVQVGDEIITIRTTAETVGPALAQDGLALQGRDYSIPDEDQPLPGKKPILIVRVREDILLEQEQIQFITEYQASNDLDLDQLQILSGGEFGLEAQRVRVLYEDGEEISRRIEKEWVVKESKPRVIGYGTRINLESTNTAHGKITYWRKITAYATSYDSTCPGCDTITASGSVLKKGSIAVTLDWYQYMKGAKVYIPGYGFGTIEDVGGGVPWSTNWVDLGYKKEEYVPWSENVTVYFLAPAPSPENIMYILY